jgi:putative thiamine transport system ATP-binding protein
VKDGLWLDNIRIWRQDHLLLEVNIHITSGEIVTLMGPSGSGKSTLLAYICGMLPEAFHAEGGVYLLGEAMQNMAPEKRDIGLLFQDDLLFPFLSVAGNLAFGLKSGGRRAERDERIAEALENAGLPDFGARDPASLSGGERARISLLRTLLAEPKALLLDEPFSKLDTNLRASFREFVFTQARARQLPVLMVSHDIADAQASGGKIIQLSA